MMKRSLLLIFTVILVVFTAPAHCQIVSIPLLQQSSSESGEISPSTSMPLIIQQSPSNGGEISPGIQLILQQSPFEGGEKSPSILLLLQQTPPQGGVITPGPGVHSFPPNAKIILTAIPKPGYDFVYWLGDVDDPTASSTEAYLDKPKVIIAVFRQKEYGSLFEGGGSSTGGGAIPRRGSATSTADYSYPTGGGGGGSPEPPNPLLPNPPQLPPVPEPATSLLVVVGSLFALARRRAIRRA